MALTQEEMKKIAQLFAIELKNALPGMANRSSGSRSSGSGSGSRNTQSAPDRSSGIQAKTSAELLKNIKDLHRTIRASNKRSQELSQKSTTLMMDLANEQRKRPRSKAAKDAVKKEIDRLNKELGEVADELQSLPDAIQSYTKQLEDATAAWPLFKNGLVNSVNSIDSISRSASKSIQTSWDAFDKASLTSRDSILKGTSVLSGLVEGYGLSNEEVDKYQERMIHHIKSSSAIFSQALGGKSIETINEFSEALHILSQKNSVLEKFVETNNGNIKSTIETLLKLEESGIALDDAQQELLKTVREYGLVNEANIVSDDAAFEAHINSIKADIRAVEQHARAEHAGMKVTSYVKDKMGVFGKIMDSNIGSFAKLGIALEQLSEGLKKGYDQSLKAAEAGAFYNGSFSDMSYWNIKLGVGFEETFKLLQTNRQVIGDSRESVNDFYETINKGQDYFMKWGVNSNDAVKATQDSISIMRKAGSASLKNSKDMTKMLKDQSISYAKLKATTGATTEEFKALQEETINNTAVQERLQTLNATDRAAFLNGLNETRQSFIDLGMSADHAQKVMMSFQDAGKMKLKERYNAAAKLQQAMRVSGRYTEEQILKAGSLIKNNLAIASDKDKAYMKDVMAGMSNWINEANSMGGDENAMQIAIRQAMGDGLQPISSMMEASAAGKQSEGSVDTSKKNQQTALDNTDMDKVTGGGALRTIQDLQKGIAAVVENPLVEIVAGLGILISLGGGQLAALLKIAASSLGDLVGKSKLGQLAGKAGGAISSAGSAAIATGWAAPVAGMAVGGAMMYSAYDDAKEKRLAKEKGGDISERTAWNDWGVLLGKERANKWGLKTELNEYNEDGTRIKPMDTVNPNFNNGSANPVPANIPSPSVNPPTQSSTGLVTAPMSNAPTSTGSQIDSQRNGPVISLSEDTIQKLAQYLQTINTTQASSLEVEKQQLAMLVSLVDANEEAKDAAERLSHGSPVSFGDGWKKYEFMSSQ